MNVTIDKAVGAKLPARAGRPAVDTPNEAKDVRKIQELLNLLAVSRMPVTGTCGQDTINAISAFQKLWGPVTDGRVDPSSASNSTLGRMNALATALEPSAPEKQSPGSGGYKIGYTGKRPPEPYRVLLNVTSTAPMPIVAGTQLSTNEAQHCMEVTTRPTTDLLSKDNLRDFLSIVEKRDLWGDKKAAVRIIVWRDGQVVSVSQAKQFKAPVKPWSKRIAPKEFGVGDDGPKLKYIGTGEAPFIGRYFYAKAIGGKYYWKYGSELVTDDQYRGFDCICYVGSLYLVEPVAGDDNPYGSSANMADALNATPVNWKGSDGSEVKNGEAKGTMIKKFFEQPAHTGTYLLWKGSHITLVLGKRVHEFAHSKGGYGETDVSAWVGNSVDYHLYLLPADKQF